MCIIRQPTFIKTSFIKYDWPDVSVWFFYCNFPTLEKDVVYWDQNCPKFVFVLLCSSTLECLSHYQEPCTVCVVGKIPLAIAWYILKRWKFESVTSSVVDKANETTPEKHQILLLFCPHIKQFLHASRYIIPWGKILFNIGCLFLYSNSF